MIIGVSTAKGAAGLRDQRDSTERSVTRLTAPEGYGISYQLFFETGLEGMLVVAEDNALLDANPRACELLGYRREELLRAGLRGVVDPSDERWEPLLAEPRAKEQRVLELRLLRRDGNSFVAEVKVAAPRDADGGFSGVIFRERSGVEEITDEAAHLGRALIENGPDLIALYDADDTLSYVSPSVEQILGYGPEELVGTSVLDLVHPDDMTLMVQEIEGATSDPGRRSPPVRYRHKDGSWVHMENVASNLLHDPSVEGIVVDGRDVTERKEAEEALRESEGRLRALLQNASGVGMILEPGGSIRYGSPSIERVLGYGAEELVGRDAFDYLHPEDGERFRTTVAQAVQSDAPTTAEEFRLRHKDGSWRHLKARVHDLSDDPDIGGLVVDFQDVTERKETEEALRQSEARYRAVLEQTTENIYLVDVRTKRILEANAAARDTLGYAADELERLTLYDVVDHDRESVDQTVRRVMEEKRSRIGERRYQRKDGSLVDVEVYAGAVYYRGKQVLCVVARDVTRRKRTEESLRRSLGVLLALREAGQILGATLETEEIITRLLKIMRGVSGLTAAVISVEDELGQPRIWREVGLEGLWRRARYAPEAEEARRTVLEKGEHRLFRLRRPGEEAGELVGLCLPLQMRERIAGVLEAYGPESLAGDDAVEILRSLAAQAASALENARLYGELAEREKRLADLVGQLFTAQEEERRRVAYEVHDGLAQVAAAAHQHLQGFARFYPPDSEEGRTLLTKALELVQRTVGEARRVIADLRPTALDDFGLRTALRLETEGMRADGWQVGFKSNMADDERLPNAVETAFFRITQEALTNIRRHADTKRVRVTLDRLEGRARLDIRDWGRGFDPSASRGGGPGERVGLHSMRERVALLGGRFEVQSRPDAGVLITVEVPLPGESGYYTAEARKASGSIEEDALASGGIGEA